MLITRGASSLLFLFLLSLLVLDTGPARAEVLRVTPAPGAVVSESRPVICVDLPAGGTIRHEDTRLWVNGLEVTGSSLRTPMFVSYQAPGQVPAGPVEVRFAYRTSDGQTVDQTWSFQVKPMSHIASVRHDAAGELGQYDDLQVEMQADPVGQAWFEIEGLADEVPMQEVSPGLYRGTYSVKPGDFRLQAAVIGHLRLDSGTSALEADHPVSVFGHLFRVRVYEPLNGAQVPLNFVIRGRTRPFARISVTPRIGFNEALTAPTRDNPENDTGTIPGEADAQGNFTIKYGFPVKLPNMRLAFTVVATDADGDRSIPTMLIVHF